FPGQPIVAQISFNSGLLNFTNTNFTIGSPQRSLLATTLTGNVPSQFGSALPETLSFAQLIAARTAFSSTRVAEGFASAFQPREAGADFGTRILLKFSGYPSDARLFLPAVIAGSNALVPTRAGDFGGIPAGGLYASGSNTLLLVRVLATDDNGGGGYQASGAVTVGSSGNFDTIAEVPLLNGMGVAVFEVIDANPSLPESAQIPVFLGLPRSVSARNVALGLQVGFGPISTSAIANTFSPIPRFVNVAPQSDCPQFSDCGLNLPKLRADPFFTQFRLVQGVGVEQRVINVSNDGGGTLSWTVTVDYKSGRDWIFLDRTSGTNSNPIRMIVRALTELVPGTYEATVTVDAGSAGVARYPITLQVIPIPQLPEPTPKITSVVNGASFESGQVARGSYITIRGENLAGSTIAITLDSKPVTPVYTSASQINLRLPADLTAATAQLVVTVNGKASAPYVVNVAPVRPGIFNPGILNQDGSVNSPANPANTGSFVQIYATGLLLPDGSGVVDARLHDQNFARLPYAGPAPGIPGVQQVNLEITAGLPTMTTEVLLCSTAGGASRQCSAPVKIHIRRDK
ncbi:MAG: IPT/TIG domain-containing protein, partial [Bryobacteraceae bacterium]|nr:IPT/TIG domain-containing protein [Bryobacteraceae bacterium]